MCHGNLIVRREISGDFPDFLIRIFEEAHTRWSAPGITWDVEGGRMMRSTDFRPNSDL